jgi:hypothetical protein
LLVFIVIELLTFNAIFILSVLKQKSSLISITYTIFSTLSSLFFVMFFWLISLSSKHEEAIVTLMIIPLCLKLGVLPFGSWLTFFYGNQSKESLFLYLLFFYISFFLILAQLKSNVCVNQLKSNYSPLLSLFLILYTLTLSSNIKNTKKTEIILAGSTWLTSLLFLVVLFTC